LNPSLRIFSFYKRKLIEPSAQPHLTTSGCSLLHEKKILFSFHSDEFNRRVDPLVSKKDVKNGGRIVMMDEGKLVWGDLSNYDWQRGRGGAYFA